MSVSKQSKPGIIPILAEFDSQTQVIKYNGRFYIDEAASPRICTQQKEDKVDESDLFLEKTKNMNLVLISNSITSALTEGNLSINKSELIKRLKNGTEEEKEMIADILDKLYYQLSKDKHELMVTLIDTNELLSERSGSRIDAVLSSLFTLIILISTILLLVKIGPKIFQKLLPKFEDSDLVPWMELLKAKFEVLKSSMTTAFDYVNAKLNSVPVPVESKDNSEVEIQLDEALIFSMPESSPSIAPAKLLKREIQLNEEIKTICEKQLIEEETNTDVDQQKGKKNDSQKCLDISDFSIVL
jgi:hypothetical protein